MLNKNASGDLLEYINGHKTSEKPSEQNKGIFVPDLEDQTTVSVLTSLVVLVPLIFGAIGGILGAARNRLMYGLIVGTLFGPIGWFMVAKSKDAQKKGKYLPLTMPILSDKELEATIAKAESRIKEAEEKYGKNSLEVAGYVETLASLLRSNHTRMIDVVNLEARSRYIRTHLPTQAELDAIKAQEEAAAEPIEEDEFAQAEATLQNDGSSTHETAETP